MKVQADFIQVPKPFNSLETPPFQSQDVAKPTFATGLRVLNKLHESKYSVFLVYSSTFQRKLALKVFPHNNERPCLSYLNESQFSSLSHPNIVKMLECVDKQKSCLNTRKFNSSCILMEYATFGDFSDLVINTKFYQDEILGRTFFHQLIDGIEYLHSHNIGHMDLKLENLLLGDDLMLKIADFDLSCIFSCEKYTKGRGTANYRAPELKNKSCYDARAADVYSAGIILFTFISGGFPGVEDRPVEGYDLHEMMLENDENFWNAHSSIQGKEIFSDDFKDLFFKMISKMPDQRITIDGIKRSKWYHGKTYSPDEMKVRLADFGISCDESIPSESP